ncbi:MAG: carbohydrate-binding protein [Stackebrandtia sp.]
MVFGAGDGGPGDPGDPGQCESAAWNAATAYTGGALVSHGGSEYRAKWWTRGEEPGAAGVWERLRSCG